MFRSIAETVRSLWSHSTSSTDRVSTGSKRKRNRDEWDDDPDLHITRVEKKRRLESSASSTIVRTIKQSASRMAEWIRPKSQRYNEQFQTIPREASSRWNNSVTQMSSDTSRGPQINGDDREMANHRFEVRHNIAHYRGNSGNSNIRLDHTGESRSSTRSPIFQNKPSTASMCIRLKEKEEYQKLIQLHHQRSPWQGPVSSSISSDRPVDSDVITISSNSSYEGPSINRKEQQTRSSTVSSSHRDDSLGISTSGGSLRPHVRSLDILKPDSLSALLYKQRMRSGISSYQRSEASGYSKSNSSEAKTHTRDENYGGSEAIVIDDEEEDSRNQSVSSSRAASKNGREDTGKVSQHHTTADQSISASFLRSRFMNDHDVEDQRKRRMEEQERRKRLIAEEEQKAKAYAEKRRAQEISLEKKLKYQMRIFDEEPEISEEIFREEEEEEEEEKMPGLTQDMEVKISEAMRPGNPSEVLSEGFRLQITRRDIATLSGLNWLNDEVINFYMNMLMERGEQDGRSKVYAFNTFFYPKIMSGGHAAVKRWTKKVDIFAMHYILIPVHLGMHWCLCVVNMKDKVITYYDSMGAKNTACLKAVLEYINDESRAKRDVPINKDEWKLVNAKDNPHQMNGGDCGMFMCKYAEYITRGKEITFTQENMPYFRRRMVYEILTKKLLQ